MQQQYTVNVHGIEDDKPLFAIVVKVSKHAIIAEYIEWILQFVVPNYNLSIAAYIIIFSMCLNYAYCRFQEGVISTVLFLMFVCSLCVYIWSAILHLIGKCVDVECKQAARCTRKEAVSDVILMARVYNSTGVGRVYTQITLIDGEWVDGVHMCATIGQWDHANDEILPFIQYKHLYFREVNVLCLCMPIALYYCHGLHDWLWWEEN